MIIFLAGLRQIPHDMYEAASLDGAGEVAAVLEDHPAAADAGRSSSTPSCRPSRRSRAFTPAFIISGGTGGPINSTLFYTLYLYQEAFALLPHGLRLGAGLDPRSSIIALFTALLVPHARATGCTTTTDAAPPDRRRPAAAGPPPARSRRSSSHVAADRAPRSLMLYPLLWMLAASFRPRTRSSPPPRSVPERSRASTPIVRGWNGLRVSFGAFFWNSLVIAVLARHRQPRRLLARRLRLRAARVPRPRTSGSR